MTGPEAVIRDEVGLGGEGEFLKEIFRKALVKPTSPSALFSLIMRVKCHFSQERKALYERIRSRPLQTCFLILHFKIIQWISGSADKDRKALVSGFCLHLSCHLSV